MSFSNNWTGASNVRETTAEFPSTSKTLFVSGIQVPIRLRMLEMERSNDGVKITVAFFSPEAPLTAQRSSQSSGYESSVGDADASPSHSVPNSAVVPQVASNPYAFRCFNCSKSFTTRYMLRRHEVVHAGTFRCPRKGCGSTYRNQTTLTKHCIVEHGLKLQNNQSRIKIKVPKLTFGSEVEPNETEK